MDEQLIERHKALLKGEAASPLRPKAEKINPHDLIQSLKKIHNDQIPTYTNGNRPQSLKHRKHKQGDHVTAALAPEPMPGLGSIYNVINTNDWPFTCVGKVIVATGIKGDLTRSEVLAVGTGVMVGPRVMLTASHIMPDGAGEENHDPWWISFFAGLDDFGATVTAPSFVQQYHYLADSSLASGGSSGNDVAVCILELPLGFTSGWWGSESRGYAVDYEPPVLPGFMSVGYYQNQDDPNGPVTPAMSALTLVSREVQLNQVQLENQAFSGEQHFSGDLPSLPPDDTADLRNWRFRTDAYAEDAWVGGPLWTDAAGSPLDPNADGRDGSTNASVSPQNESFITSPRVIGVVGRNYVDGDSYTCHGGGILMVYMIQHANTLFPT